MGWAACNHRRIEIKKKINDKMYIIRLFFLQHIIYIAWGKSEIMRYRKDIKKKLLRFFIHWSISFRWSFRPIKKTILFCIKECQ